MVDDKDNLQREEQFLSAPFLQFPSSHCIHVVWFTSFEGKAHWVEWEKEGQHHSFASSRCLSRIREEKIDRDGYVSCSFKPVWRHEAEVTGLTAGVRQSYRVISQTQNSNLLSSPYYTLAPAPQKGQALKILLTSDHQRKPMVAANLQKAVETIGKFDAVFFAGDLVEWADGYADWFTDRHGFFPCLQGKAESSLNEQSYTGGEIIQHAPIFPAIGNHDVMGRYSLKMSLQDQFHDPYPLDRAAQLYPSLSQDQLKDLSFNTDTYEEIFTLPIQSQDHSTYYATTFGEIRLVVLYATRIWRSSLQDVSKKGKYQEAKERLNDPEEWGYGDFIFEPLHKDSRQYEWLEKELQSESFQQAKFRLIMLHNPFHTLGENSVPPFTDPVQTIRRDKEGNILAIDYAYPKKQDVLIRDIEPLLEKYGVDLVLCGHSHLWNRFQSKKGMHFLETSNVGNSYGAYTTENQQKRELVPNNPSSDYAEKDDPNGLSPLTPTLAPLKDEEGNPLPYIASNELTVFSVLDTERKVIDSYYFDTRHPEKSVVKFDSFCPYRRLSTKEVAERYTIKINQALSEKEVNA